MISVQEHKNIADFRILIKKTSKSMILSHLLENYNNNSELYKKPSNLLDILIEFWN